MHQPWPLYFILYTLYRAGSAPAVAADECCSALLSSWSFLSIKYRSLTRCPLYLFPQLECCWRHLIDTGFIQNCWHEEPSARPHAKLLLERVRSLSNREGVF